MPQLYPQKPGIESILKQAFSYWSRTLLYQVLFSLITFSVYIVVGYYFAVKYGIMDHYLSLSARLSESMESYQQGVQEMTLLPNFMTFYWIMIATAVFLYPLNLGFFKMYRKMDLGEKPALQDLFAGYQGINFFIFTSYFLFWILIYLYTIPTVILGFAWVLLTLFTAPLMFFMSRKLFETIPLNFKGLKRYPLEIFVCCIVALLFKYIGLFTIVGAVFTYPFWNAMIYALYRRVFNEVH
ncbi:hypothetical protein [Chryseobacterium sp. A301]